MLRLLITGGTGNLGSTLIKVAMAKRLWEDVCATYHSRKPNYHDIVWVPMDGQVDPQETLQRLQPTHIIHTLAMSSPDVCEVNKLEAWRINVQLTQELAEYADASACRLIFTSTDLIFDGNSGNYDEDSIPAPLNFYGDTKVEAESVLRERLSNFVIARISLMYGFNLNGGMNFFSGLVEKLRQKQTVMLFHDQVRTMLSIPNAAEALLDLASGSYCGTVHIGGPQAVSRYEFGKTLAKRLGVEEGLVLPESMKNERTRVRRPADVSLRSGVLDQLGLGKILDIDAGLEQVLQHFQK